MVKYVDGVHVVRKSKNGWTSSLSRDNKLNVN